MVSKTSDASPYNISVYQWFLTFDEWLKSRPGTDWPQHVCLVPYIESRELFLCLGCITYKNYIHHFGLEENELLNLFYPIFWRSRSVFSVVPKNSFNSHWTGGTQRNGATPQKEKGIQCYTISRHPQCWSYHGKLGQYYWKFSTSLLSRENCQIFLRKCQYCLYSASFFLTLTIW